MSNLIAIGKGLALGWSKNERKSCFPMSMTSSLSSRDRNNAANFRHIYFCHEDEDDVGDIGKHEFWIVWAWWSSSTTFLVYYLISDYRRGMTLEDGKLAQISFNTRIWKQTNLPCITVAISNDLSGTSKASVPDPVIDSVQENCNASSINVFVLE